jgi:hypothetical protein
MNGNKLAMPIKKPNSSPRGLETGKYYRQGGAKAEGNDHLAANEPLQLGGNGLCNRCCHQGENQLMMPFQAASPLVSRKIVRMMTKIGSVHR